MSSTTAIAKIGRREEWLAAREKLLEREKEHTRLGWITGTTLPIDGGVLAARNAPPGRACRGTSGVTATDETTVTVGSPFVWRLSLTSPAERVFELLDTDTGRERFWALSSRTVPGGFELEFPGGLQGRVDVLERQEPTRLAIRYFASEAELELKPREDGGCLFQVTCRCDDPAAWLQFYPGWVSWLLTLKAAADYDVDLRNGAPGRAWDQRYVDP